MTKKDILETIVRAFGLVLLVLYACNYFVRAFSNYVGIDEEGTPSEMRLYLFEGILHALVSLYLLRGAPLLLLFCFPPDSEESTTAEANDPTTPSP
jgi:hypothetical protein